MHRRFMAGAGLALFLFGAPLVLAQGGPLPDPSDDNGSDHPANGVFHGNYCGIGDNGPGLPPTDALDQACMHHDACTPSGGVPSCACNERFLQETRSVVSDPETSDTLRATARMVEAAIPAIPCR